MFAVHAQFKPNMTVKVEAGNFLSSGAIVEFPGATSQAITAPSAPATKKFVLFYISANAQLRVLESPAVANNPVLPTVLPETVPLAFAAVKFGDTSISDDMIFDLRPLFVVGSKVPLHTEIDMQSRGTPDQHPITAITGLTQALAAKLTEADITSELDAKADSTGTAEDSFEIGEGGTGTPTSNKILKFNRGALGFAGIKINEAEDQLEYSVDGTNWTPLAAMTGTDFYTKAQSDDMLALKAGATALTDGLATKVSATALTDGLALKADASAMTDALALKATVISVTDGLALKANASALADKADAATALVKNTISGSFTTNDGKTITVVDGQITAIA